MNRQRSRSTSLRSRRKTLAQGSDVANEALGNLAAIVDRQQDIDGPVVARIQRCHGYAGFLRKHR